jgi:hypothetical protein
VRAAEVLRRQHPTAPQRLDAQLIVMEKSLSLKASRSSVTRTVKVNVPAAVGVPEMVFSPFGSARPGGSSPATTDQVKGWTPPLAKRLPQQ